jgi:SAM-dependent methyltransferase
MNDLLNKKGNIQRTCMDRCRKFLFGTVKKMSRFVYRIFMSIISVTDKFYLSEDTPLSKTVGHQQWQEYLYGIGNKPGGGMKILEIGSREVTGKSEARLKFSNATYIGFDFYPGNNVDVVGDAHKLSSYFDDNEKFDIIYSHAVFEHFAMPWIVAKEIAKLLKVGGLVFVETHFSYSSHERPWHFFQYSDMALKVLFSPAMGFECIEAGMSNPMIGRFSSLADNYLKYKPIKGLYCHVEYLGKKTKDVRDFDWDKINLTDVVGKTKYPEPK